MSEQLDRYRQQQAPASIRGHAMERFRDQHRGVPSVRIRRVVYGGLVGAVSLAVAAIVAIRIDDPVSFDSGPAALSWGQVSVPARPNMSSITSLGSVHTSNSEITIPRLSQLTPARLTETEKEVL